jgi:transposase
VEFLTCHDLRGYVAKLGASDAVVLEASCGAFWWADRIEEQAAQGHVLNPYRFRIIKDSWNKTDRQDARNMAKALWVYLVTGEFGIPTVHKPTLVIRELRKLFSGYDLIDRQLRTLKNAIQAALVDEGVVAEQPRQAPAARRASRCDNPAGKSRGLGSEFYHYLCASAGPGETAPDQSRASREDRGRQRAAGRADQAADEHPWNHRPQCRGVPGRCR